MIYVNFKLLDKKCISNKVLETLVMYNIYIRRMCEL